MEYRVIAERVEINGKLRVKDDVVDAKDFKPAKGTPNEDGIPFEIDEAASLLASGHIEVKA